MTALWQIKVDDTRPWDTEWTTRDERTLRIGDMDRDHRVNLLAYLERNGVGLKKRYWLASAFGPLPETDAGSDHFEFWLDRLDRMDAVEWLNSLPFVKALRSITPPGPGLSPRRWQNRRAQLRAANPLFFMEWLEEVQAA